MPWRAEPGQLPDPYHTLVSEAMLQQTQVATVVPYFERFIAEFPTVHALACADEQRVLTLWQGLGYYRRARHLHAAARAIVERHGGQVPSSVTALLELPGIGPYTAGAIASIAYGTQAAVVDGNVERVLARLLLIREPINAPQTKDRVWSIARSLVPRKNPGDHNQALMELGATVCTPKVPKCFVCPLREMCRGVQEADPQTLPVKLEKKKPTEVTHVVIAAKRNGKYLFEQRPNDGLWSSMWQMPTWEEPHFSHRLQGDASDQTNTKDLEHFALQATDKGQLREWVAERFGLKIDNIALVADFTHQTTHRTIRFIVLHTSVKTGRLKPNTGVWRTHDQLDDLPMSNPQRVAIQKLNSL